MRGSIYKKSSSEIKYLSQILWNGFKSLKPQQNSKKDNQNYYPTVNGNEVITIKDEKKYPTFSMDSSSISPFLFLWQALSAALVPMLTWITLQTLAKYKKWDAAENLAIQNFYHIAGHMLCIHMHRKFTFKSFNS